MDKNNRRILLLAGIMLSGLIILGMVLEGPAEAWRGVVEIQIHPARLLNDYAAAVSPGAALINGALVGLFGLILIRANGVTLTGPTFAAIFTLVGFGLFGKTPVNVAPIFIGVWISARIVGKRFRDYIVIALFGSALGPLVTFLAVETALPGAAGLIASVLGGIATGILLPPLAVAMLHLHQGYNLYNMGLTCGFLGLFAASLFQAAGGTFAGEIFWLTESHWALTLLVPVLSAALIIVGFALGPKKAVRDFKKILKEPGRLPSDFIDIGSLAGTLPNIGLIGLGGWAYVLAVGGDLNGPVVGGLLTIMGFGAFGTHVKNAWPVVLGVVLAGLLFGFPLDAPGPILAAIFCTTLAPLAGQFGFPLGVLAGMIHLVVVMRTGSWHGGMNLYNNGFAGGLTAAFLVAVIQWYKTSKNGF